MRGHRLTVRKARVGIVPVLIVIGWFISDTSSLSRTAVQEASAIHQESIVFDGHVHTINRVWAEGIDPWTPQEGGLHDYARATAGGVNAVIEQLYIQDQYNDYNVTVKQAVRLIETFYRVLESNPDKMELALTAADVRRIAASGKLAVVLALEGGFDMEGDLDVLRLFHRLGVRLIQLSNHNTTNAFVDAGTGAQKWSGINDHGRTVVREMNRLGIMIDISHASDAAQLQVIALSQAPVVASHHGLRHFNDVPRGLSDDVLEALAARNGLMGMHTMASFLSSDFVQWARLNRTRRREPRETLQRSPDEDYGAYLRALDDDIKARWVEDFGKPWRANLNVPATVPLPTVDDWAEQVQYAVSLAGEDYIGIGTDMMDGSLEGGHGAPNLRDFDASGYPRLTEAMLAKGLSPQTIKKVLGENWLRVFAAVTDAAEGTSLSPE